MVSHGELFVVCRGALDWGRTPGWDINVFSQEAGQTPLNALCLVNPPWPGAVMHFSPNSKSLLAWWHSAHANHEDFLTLICVNKGSSAVHVVSNISCCCVQTGCWHRPPVDFPAHSRWQSM